MKPRHQWFSLFLVLAGWVMALTASGQQQPEPDNGAATESDLYWTFPVIRDFLAPLPPQPNDDPFHPESRTRNPLTWDEHPRFFAAGTIQDATSLLTQAGISLRPGRDLAFFHQTDGILYVRACREVLDLIDQFTKTLGPDPWIRTLEVEVMIVGFSQPGLWKELATADDPRTRAENLSAEDGAVLARATVTTRSGQRAFLGQTKPAHMGASAPSAETTAPEVITTENSGEPNPGLRLEVEPLLGPDNDLMDISFKGAFCLPSASPGATPVSGYFNTSLILRSSDCSLQRLSLEGSQWKEAAILFSATIKGLDRTGWKNGQRLPSPREQRWRAFGEKPEAKGP